MKIRWIMVVLMFLLVYPQIAVAKSPYGNIDLYYNDQLLSRGEIAKPTLKIGEPFTVRIDLTVYQKSDVHVSLSETGTGNFEIINGPTTIIEDYTKGDVLDANSTIVYEWTVKATEKWAGGAMPLNFYYAIYEHGSPEPLINNGFTIAVPYITTEYYEGDSTPTTTTEPEHPTPTEPPDTTPAFTLFTAALAITLAAARRS